MASGEFRQLGRGLKAVREEHSLSGKELAERTGISASYVSEIETGKRPFTESFADRVAAAIGIPCQDLIHNLQKQCAREPQSKLPRRMLQTMTESDSSIGSTESALVREEPSPCITNRQPLTLDYRDLACYLLTSAVKEKAWEMVSSLTQQAKDGDAEAAKRVQALLEILTINPPPP